jgi:hypothetical protein
VRNRGYTARGIAIVANGVTLLIVTMLAAFGFANGGSPDFVGALLMYGPAAGLWFAYDLVRARAVTR